jgi:hypothetical protein
MLKISNALQNNVSCKNVNVGIAGGDLPGTDTRAARKDHDPGGRAV